MGKQSCFGGNGETRPSFPRSASHAETVNKKREACQCQRAVAEPSQRLRAFTFTHSLACISMHQVIGTYCLRSCLAAGSFLHRSVSLKLHTWRCGSRVTAKRLAHGSTRNRTRASLSCVRFEGWRVSRWRIVRLGGKREERCTNLA